MKPGIQAARTGIGRSIRAAWERTSSAPPRIALLLALLAAALANGPAVGDTWRGLVVAPEHRCSPDNRKRDYAYSPNVDVSIIRNLGAVYGPYTGTCFSSRRETDIEHIVSLSEAHDSGLCARSRAERKRFASDLRNLTLAAPSVNRHSKRAKDAAEWVPAINRCWFAGRVVEVRRAYGLTIDRREAFALERILSKCESTDFETTECRFRSKVQGTAGSASAPLSGDAGSSGDALALYDDNGNGMITCKEARRHGIAPVPRSHPAYRFMRDGDGDGVVCE